MISKQYLIAYALDNEYLTKMLESPLPTDGPTYNQGFSGLLYQHHLVSELPFVLHNVFRNTLLKNPQRFNLSEHEARVGGGKFDDGSRKTVTATMAVNDIINSNMGGGYSKYGGDGWALLLASDHYQFFNPDPHGTTGQTASIVQNIINIDEGGATATMATWLPDFKYLDQLKAKNLPKYPDPTISANDSQ